jgi:hypothetical protein
VIKLVTIEEIKAGIQGKGIERAEAVKKFQAKVQKFRDEMQKKREDFERAKKSYRSKFYPKGKK